MAETEQRHTLLVISEFDEMNSEESFYEVFRDFCSGSYDLVQMSVMDAYMTTLPAEVSASILSIWLFSDLHRELLAKLLAETGKPVIVHLTDDRPELRAYLDSTPGVTRVKKPASLHAMVETVEVVIAGRHPAADPEDPDPEQHPDPGDAPPYS